MHILAVIITEATYVVVNITYEAKHGNVINSDPLIAQKRGM